MEVGPAMSMQPMPWPEPDPQVAAAIHAMYVGREAPLPVVVRDRLGELFADGQFGVAFGVRGRPGWSPGRLALITVLQMAENLTDRQAAEAVRDKLSWKYALGLELTDTIPLPFVTLTPTPTPSDIPTLTPTFTRTMTPTLTDTPTLTPSHTPTPTLTETDTLTPTETPTP